MAPAKGSQTISKIKTKGYEEPRDEDPISSIKNKITKIKIKGYEEPRDEPPISSIKVKSKKRKALDMLGQQWSKDELQRFYDAYRQYGKNWKKVGAAVRTKSPDMVEALYNRNRAFLSLPEGQATAAGLIAMMTDLPNVADGTRSNKGIGRTVKQSGKVQKCGDAKLQADMQKRNEAPRPNNLYSENSISGFTSSFKKIYYGDLVTAPLRAVGKRTPRYPVLVSADENAIDNGIPGDKIIVNTSMNATELYRNTNRGSSGMNGCSTEGNERSTEANKAVLHGDGTLLETKCTGDIDMSESPEDLEKTKNEECVKDGHASDIKQGITIFANEGDGASVAQSLEGRTNGPFSRDELFVLEVLQNLVDFPTKCPQPNINIDSGKLEKNEPKISARTEGENSPDDQSKRKQLVYERSAPEARKNKKKLLKKEASAEEKNISSGKELVSLQAQPVDNLECSSLNSDPDVVMNLPELTSHSSIGLCLDVPTSNKRETDIPIESKQSAFHDKLTLQANEGAKHSQDTKLLNCLSSKLFRRWCTYEWFYSPVDYLWFMKNDFVAYLHHANLSHVQRLTRTEWSTIRSCLGKPRRFSQHFLKKERENLEKHRQDVRKYYAALLDGSIDALPADLIQPLSIGQRVTVRHPSTKELYDGTILTVNHDSYTVQFDRSDFGIERVMDTDCMPVSGLEKIPLPSKSRPAGLDELNTENMLGQLEHFKDPREEVTQVQSAADTTRIHDNNTLDGHSPSPPLQSLDHTGQSRFDSYDYTNHDCELLSCVAALLHNYIFEARRMVDAAMQAFSGNGTDSQAAAQFPSNLISNCVATVIAIKHLSEEGYPPAEVAGVLECATSMLQPRCSQNSSIYRDIENCISLLKNQMVALVPASGNPDPAMMLY